MECAAEECAANFTERGTTKQLRAAVKPACALLDNVQDRDPHAEDVDEETLQVSIQKARLNNIAVACGGQHERPSFLIQIHASEGESDDSEN